MRLRINSSLLSRYVSYFVAYRKSGTAAAHDPAHPGLRQVVEQLGTLNRSTEQDFLTIGARLMEFLDVSGGIAKGVAAAIHATAGGQGTRASLVLEHALGRCRRLVASSTEGRSHLAALRGDAVQVATIFGGFRQAVASFHAVCTMTRIEAARLGAAGVELGPLTDEVLTLARRMEAQVKRVLEAAAAIDRHVDTIATGLRGTNELLDHLALTIPQVLRHLDVFSKQQAAAADLSTQLAFDSRSVSNAIMDAVTSIQFHDITRQQIEHVVAALEHLAARKSGTNSSKTSAALHLEAMQLSSANDTFASSVARLWHDLESIASSVHGMSAHGQALMDGCGDDSTFLLEMQHCLDAIATAVQSHHAAEATTKQSAQALATTLQSMNEAATEIRELDIQLLRVALNANIRASHLGHRGDTLAVLASALQDLTTRAQDRSHQASLALETMGSAVTLLVTHPGQEDDEALKLEMITTMDALKVSSEGAALQLTAIAASASRLAEGIATARDNFRAGKLFEETVSTCLVQIEEIAVHLAAQEDTNAADGSTGTLETFARRYTMQSERDIHASATDRAAPMPMPRLVAAGDVDLGDNIELF